MKTIFLLSILLFSVVLNDYCVAQDTKQDNNLILEGSYHSLMNDGSLPIYTSNRVVTVKDFDDYYKWCKDNYGIIIGYSFKFVDEGVKNKEAFIMITGVAERYKCFYPNALIYLPDSVAIIKEDYRNFLRDFGPFESSYPIINRLSPTFDGFHEWLINKN